MIHSYFFCVNSLHDQDILLPKQFLPEDEGGEPNDSTLFEEIQMSIKDDIYIRKYLTDFHHLILRKTISDMWVIRYVAF